MSSFKSLKEARLPTTANDSTLNFSCLSFLLSCDNDSMNCRAVTEGQTPLCLATRRGDIWAVKQILKDGADVNLRDVLGETPLCLAAKVGNTTIARLLLTNGAHPDTQDENKLTALHKAALGSNLDIVALLLEHGANPNLRDSYGRTTLYYASWIHSCEIIQLISPFLSGEGFEDKSYDGATCLMESARAGCQTCANFFTQKCKINAVTKNGYMAAHYAVWSRNVELFNDLLHLTDLEMIRNCDKNIVELCLQEEKYDHLEALKKSGIDFSDLWIGNNSNNPVPPLAYFFRTEGAKTEEGAKFFSRSSSDDFHPPGTLLQALMLNWNDIPSRFRVSYLKRLIEACGLFLVSEISLETEDSIIPLKKASPGFLLELLRNGVHLEPRYEFIGRGIHCELGLPVRSLKDSCRFAIRQHLCDTQLWNSLSTPIDYLLPLPTMLKGYMKFVN